MKKITSIILFLFFTLLSITKSFSQNQNGSIDAPGDIAIVIFDSNGNDRLGFVLLDDAPMNTSIRFIDQEWENDGSGTIPGTSEGDLLWVNDTGSTINAGKVIIIDNADGTGISTNIGTTSEDDNSFNLSNGDQVLAVTGTRSAPGTFLTFYGNENSVDSYETAVLAGTGLTNGVSAHLKSGFISPNTGYYNGFTAFNGTIAEVAASVNNNDNWIFTTSASTAPEDFTGTVFGITPSITTSPTISTDDASSIAGTTVVLGGNVTADGGGTVIERGVVYAVTSINSSPQIGGAGVIKIINGTGIGAFSETFDALMTSTQYSFASYAKNGLSIGYGAVKTFTTNAPSTLTVTTLDDENDPGATLGAPGGNGLSLREAINLSTSGDSIEFLSSLSGGTITLTIASGRDLDITNKELTISGDTNGDGAPDITITGGTVDRVFDIFGDSSTDVTLNSLNVINSTATTNRGSVDDIVPTPFSGSVSGGGIHILSNSVIDRASLTVNKCRITGNIAQEDGGGIASYGVNLEINDSLISENGLSGDGHADDGAGLKINQSIATLTNTTVAFNTAENPTGTGNGDGDTIAGRGGFDIVSRATVTITNCTIAGNIGRISTSEGDEITITGGSSPSTLTVINSIIGGEAQRDPSNQDITNSGTLTVDSNTLITQSIVNNGTQNGTATQDVMANIFDTTVTSNFIASNALQLNGGIIETIKLASGVTAGSSSVVATTPVTVAFTNTSSSGNESVNSADLEVSLSAVSASNVSVDYTVTGTATGNGTDYTLANGTLIFTAGDLNNDITIASIVSDAILEANETVIVTISSPTNAILGTNTIHTYTINNDDSAAVTIANASGNENDGSITVTATLDNAVQGGFTLDVSTLDGTAATADSDYSAVTSQTLTFTGNASEIETFTITPTGDSKLEANETLTVSQSNLASTTLSVNITDGATVTIDNDDSAAVTIANASGNENDGSITVTATLDNAVQGGFTLDVSTLDGTATTADSDYSAVTSQTLTFTGNASETETFTIIPTGDFKLESNETITVSQSNLAATALVLDITDGATVTINNDDFVATVTTDDSSSLTSNTVDLGGDVTNQGSSSVTDRGIVYAITSENASPQVGGTDVVKDDNGSGSGTFNETILSLVANTQYSYVAYATNSSGTAYGTIKTFTTATLGLGDTAFDKSIDLYPNPVDNLLYIKLNNIKVNKVTLFDILGKSVRVFKFLNEPLDFSRIKSGVYIMKIKTSQGVAFRRIVRK